ncbi:unnamed protein product [Triticum turgidum subsp. durum]|uniref:Uncharacterized protein n=1 Tax=Triticum turgidum subsp. durum TaxID=4567 RepID=A0A9R0YX95_TRITD|nr:unnamed protein product [Triticum turgidum subsp. durum]
MEGKEEDVRLGANRYSEHQPIGTAAQGGGADEKDYKEPPPAPFFEAGELTSWSFYRAGIAEFLATFLFLYISVLTVMGVVGNPSGSKCGTVGIQGIAWSFGGMIFVLVYCTAGISGGHINPAVTFGLFLARKLSLTRAVFYIVMQCLGAICGAGVVKGFQTTLYQGNGGGANSVAPGYTKGDGLGAEIVGTFVLVYTVFSATDAKRSARDSHVPRFRSGSRCSWCTWPRSPSRAPASTRRGPWAPPSSTTRSRRGTTTGSSGWVRSSARRWRPSTTWW